MKVIDRVFYKLDEQLSIDEDYYVHVEKREIISNGLLDFSTKIK